MSSGPDTLPIAAEREAILSALGAAHLVLTSPPGSGKSTLVPLWALELAPRVLVIEPRRVACRSLARYVAQKLDTPLGQQVGYAIRHDDRLSAETKIAFVTPGVALRMLEERRVEDETLVVLDEFHERTLELDLLLAVLLARAHGRFAVLSATLEAQKVARHIGGQHLHVSGRQYPLALRYLGDDPLPHGRHLAERVAAALRQLEAVKGDALVFLPGKAEIAACAAQLAGNENFSPLPLHAGLSAKEQDRAFEPTARPRAILATNVAETSITLPGVRAVIDSGLLRRTTYREGRGALALMSISAASADQRAGRAARLAPGVCLRLWHRSGKLEDHTPPEIQREDLSGLMLAALRLGHDPATLPWLDPPRPFAFAEAERVLMDLGAAQRTNDQAGELLLSETGQKLGALPLDAALGRLLVAAMAERALLADMILLVASLGSRRALFAPGEPRLPDDGSDDLLTRARCDAAARVLALRDPRRFAHRLRRDGLDEALQNARQLARLLDTPLPAPSAPFDREGLLRLIVLASPASAFARRKRRHEAWGNGRVELRLGRDSLIADDVRTIVVVDQWLQGEPGRTLHRFSNCAMPAHEELLRRLGCGEEHTKGAGVDSQGQLLARMEWSIGTTVLRRFEKVPDGDAARQALEQALLSARLFKKAIADARDEVEAYNLSQSLEGGSMMDFERWLKERIATLGFERGDELELLTESDFAPALLTSEAKAALDARFPRALSIAGRRLAVHYDARRREITICGKGNAPRTDLLPRWGAWGIFYDDGKKRVRLSGR